MNRDKVSHTHMASGQNGVDESHTNYPYTTTGREIVDQSYFQQRLVCAAVSREILKFSRARPGWLMPEMPSKKAHQKRREKKKRAHRDRC